MSRSTLGDIIRERKLRELGLPPENEEKPSNLSDSGSKKKRFEKPKRAAEKALNIMLDMMHDANGGGVNVIENRPESFPIIMSYYVLFFITWAVVVYELTLTGQAKVYLSAQSTSEDQICTEIPTTISSTYQGDVYGGWETNNTFSQNSSAFVLQFVGSKLTTEQYIKTMTSFKSQLLELSQKSAMRDSAWNAVMWSSFLFYDPVAQMSFYSSADAATGNEDLPCSAGIDYTFSLFPPSLPPDRA